MKAPFGTCSGPSMADKGIGMMHTVSGVGFPLDLDVTLETILGRGLDNGFQTGLFFQTMNLDKIRKRKLPRVGGCFATALDGCFGSEDAALRQPYANHPQNRGILFHSDDEVIQFAKRANREGLQIEMHAIGDAAFDQAVMAIEVALKDFPRQDRITATGSSTPAFPPKRGFKSAPTSASRSPCSLPF